MSTIPVTIATQIARNAGAVYGIELGTEGFQYCLNQARNEAELDQFLNNVYTWTFVDQGITTADVALNMVHNFGIPAGAAGDIAFNYIVNALDSVPASERGATVNDIITLYVGLADDPTFGEFATAYNNKVQQSLDYSATNANNAEFSVFGASTWTLTSGVDNIDFSTSLSGVVDNVYGIDTGFNVLGHETSTYTSGDTILGNGSTDFNLTIANDGLLGRASVAALVKDVNNINLTMISDGLLQGNGFTRVNHINVTGGSDGTLLYVENLKLNTELTISGVTGTISADYVGGRHLDDIHVEVFNADAASTGSALIDAERNVSMSVGDDGSLVVSASNTSGTNIDIGNISMEAGNNADLNIYVNNSNSSSDTTTIGDISLVGGNLDVVNVTIEESGTIEIGNIEMNFLKSASIDVYADASIVGDVNIIAGENSSVSIDLEWDDSPTQGIDVGSVDIALGNNSFINARIGVWGQSTQDISVGDVTLLVDGSGSADISITNVNWGGSVGDITVGIVDIEVGDGYAGLNIYNDANGSYDTAGNISVGNITLQAGNEVSLSSDSGVSVTIEQSAWYSERMQAGDVTVGDVNLTVGNGVIEVTGVSGTTDNKVSADLYLANWGQFGVGDLNVGNIDMTGGDLASLNVTLTGYNETGTDSSGSSVGSMSVGDVTYSAGDSSTLDFSADWGSRARNSGNTVGDLTIGVIDVTAVNNAAINIDAHSYISDSSSNSNNNIGNLEVGTVTVVAEDNSSVNIDLTQYAGFGSGTSSSASMGDVNIGAIDVTLGLSSDIKVSISSTHWGAGQLTGANLDIGSIDLTVGGDGAGAANIDLNINYEGSFEQAGDVTVGDITLKGGTGSNVNGSIYVLNNTNGNMGAIDIASLNLDAGSSSSNDFMVRIDHNHYNGGLDSFSLGAVDLTADVNSNINVTVNFEDFSSTLSSIGDINVGDVTADVADSADVNVSMLAQNWAAFAGIGNVNIGKIDATLGLGSTFVLEAVIATNNEIASVTAGAISLNVMNDASANILIRADASSTGIASNMNVGNIDVSLSDIDIIHHPIDGGYAAVTIDQLNGSNDTLHIGDITVDVADNGIGIGGEANINLATYGDLVIGDITVSGDGEFILDGASHGGLGVSYLAANTAFGTATIGDVDFSGYTNSAGAIIDLSFSDFGARYVTGSTYQDDITLNNAVNTVITGQGDSGTGPEEFDIITGFDVADDFLDFNNGAATASNLQIGAAAVDLTQFISDADTWLNTSGTHTYYAANIGANTYVATDYLLTGHPSGNTDMIIELVGVTAGTLSFDNIVG